MKHKKFIIPLIVIIFFAIGSGTFYFFNKDFQQKFFPSKDTTVPGGAIARNEPVVTCAAEDKACEAKNEKIMANRIEGPAASFAKHQCDGPRACPTPNEEETKTFTDAIKKYAKEPNLELIRVNGINPAGITYYCAKDGRCWSYSTKEKKVTVFEQEERITPPPPSTNSKQ